MQRPGLERGGGGATRSCENEPSSAVEQDDLGAVVVTDNRMEPAAHKAFVAAEIAKLKPVIEAAKQFAD